MSMISPHQWVRRGSPVAKGRLASAGLKVILVQQVRKDLLEMTVNKDRLGSRARPVKKARTVSPALRGIKVSPGTGVLRGLPGRRALKVLRETLDLRAAMANKDHPDPRETPDLEVTRVQRGIEARPDLPAPAEAASRAAPCGTPMLVGSPRGS